MRSLFIILAAAATVSAYQTCTPGTYYRTECNTCRCNKDGSASICTENPCPPGLFNKDGSLKVPLDLIKEIIPEATEIEVLKSQLVEVGHVTYVQVCTPNSFFHVDCNSCTCSALGTEYACTKMACPPKLTGDNEIGYPRAIKSVEDQTCKPKSQFKEYCNHCICSADGSNYACTKMACDHNIFNKDGSLKAPLVCEPLSHFYDYCNTCTCSKDGLTAACTKKACDKNMFNKDGSLKYPYNTLIKAYRSVEQKKVCEAGKVFHDYCNQCICALDGIGYACTKMYCDKNTWNKDGTLKTEFKSRVDRSVENQVCEPGKSFKEYCNNCVCSEDGLHYACTKKACDKNVFNKDGSLKAPLVCEPGSHFKNDCNDCFCTEDGLNAACTALACDPEIYNKDGTLKNLTKTRSLDNQLNQNWGSLYTPGDVCTPGHIFYSLCNQCICLPNGLSAYCTIMMCYQD